MFKNFKANKSQKILFLIIILLGLFLRIIGLNWDQGQHLHPDERFLTMVLTDIKIPQDLTEYLNPKISSLNPYNQKYSFFVYGSFPINFVKIIGEIIKFNSYDQIYLVGRVVTIIIDTLIILLIYLICKKIINSKFGLISAFLYSTCVLPIQLSRFYTVDPFLNFFIFLSFYFLVKLSSSKNKLLAVLFLSFSFSLSLSSKISAIYFLPIVLILFLYIFRKNFKDLLIYGILFSIFTIIFFRFLQPQFFNNGNYFDWHINPQFLNNLNELKSWDKNPAFPPAIQWIKVTPILFPFKNILFWGLGFPLSVFFIISTFFCINFFIKNKSKQSFFLIISFFWILFLILIQGSQSVSTIRYFLPIYPFICIVSGFYLYFLIKNKLIPPQVLSLFLIYPLMFNSIFFKPHTRLSASHWIYDNISPSSTIATEYWDDPLPLSLKNNSNHNYNNIELHVADIEDNQKINKLIDQLNQSDYYILSSNRFYKPIPQNYEIFPETSKFYKSLFDGTLGFKKVAEFTSYPCFFGFCLNDDNAEEAFTVYDHPKVIIFQKVSHIDQ